jgi:hypothetical protein
VTNPPLIPAAVYGLRTWRPVDDEHGEALGAAHKDVRWPDGGAWLEASCDKPDGHDAPHADCSCGIYAWHPRRASARRVLGARFEVPGIVEAAGAIELQDDGFRAQRGRPYALVVTPGRNLARARRLARRYDARVVEVAGPDELVAWCAEHDLGLAQDTVERLLGPEYAARRAEDRRRRRRRTATRVGLLAALAAGLVGFGAAFATGPPSSHGVYGRTGWVTCPQPPAGAPPDPGPPPTPPAC